MKETFRLWSMPTITQAMLFVCVTMWLHLCVPEAYVSPPETLAKIQVIKNQHYIEATLLAQKVLDHNLAVEFVLYLRVYI